MRADPTGAASWLLAFRQAGDLTFEGYARDLAEPGRRLVVELRLDGATIAATVADLAAPGRIDELDPYCGFAFVIPEQLAVDEPLVEAWIANSEIRIGAPLRLAPFRRLRPAALLAGEVGWHSGLQIEGWCRDPLAFPIAIRAEDGELLTMIPSASGLADAGRFALPGPRPGFRGALPRRLADGDVHRLHVTDAAGEELGGSPLTVCIDPDCARDADCVEATAGPAASPHDTFGPPEPRDREGAPVGFIFVGEGDLDQSVAALEGMRSCDWVAAALASGAGPGVLDRAALQQALEGELSSCEILFVAPAGIRWTEAGVRRLSDVLLASTQACIAHGDLWLDAANAATDELSYGAFDYHRCLRQPYPSIAFALRAQEMSRAAAETEAELSLARLFLRRLDPVDPQVIHLPLRACSAPVSQAEALAPSWERAVRAQLAAQGLAAATVRSEPTTPLPSLVIETPAAAQGVSVLCPVSSQTAEQAVALVRRLLVEPPPGGLEVLLIEAGVHSPAAEDRIDAAGAVVRRIQTKAARHDLARQMNEGVQQAANDHVVLLDPTLTPLGSGAIEALAALLREPNIATATGAIVDDEGWVAEAGFWTGFGFQPRPACAGWPLRSDRQAGRLGTIHAVAGTSWNLMALQRQAFMRLDGFDDRHFTSFFFAADFCFRAAGAGYRHLVEPRALFRRGALPIGRSDPAPRNIAFARELAMLRQRWPKALAVDPFYSPRLDAGGLLRPARKPDPAP